MKPLLLFLLLLTGASQCGDSATALDPVSDELVVRSGTSFGMCMGYCVKRLELAGTKAIFTQESHIDKQRYPTKSCQRVISQEKAMNLKSMARFDAFQKLPKRFGCPDCADGGAEFIEMQFGNQTHKVEFEYGKTIPGFEALVRDLRAQRAEFDTCN